MSRVKEIAELSQEIIKKLEETIVQTFNARLFYEKYQSLLDQAKETCQKNMFLCEIKPITMKQSLSKNKNN